MCNRTEMYERIVLEGDAKKLAWYARQLLNHVFRIEEEVERLRVINKILLEHEHEQNNNS
jgi:hypothetical protein